MEDHHHHQGNNNNQDPNSPNHGSSAERSEPVRSRWTPKPEQILILESIFNSGMVNPPKDETVRIRRLLEKFGSVGDANVFYWFQNRRSRSRRRQRQLQASLASSEPKNNYQQASNTTACGGSGGGGAIPYGQNSNSAAVPMGFSSNNSPCLITSNTTPSNFMLGSSSSSSSSCGVMGGDGVVDANFYSIPSQMGFQEIDQSSSVTSMLCPSETSSLPYQSGFITVFLNGVPTEVPRGLIDMKAVFGQDVVLIHSSGVPVPINEFGVLMQTLQHGESYFLVSRTA